MVAGWIAGLWLNARQRAGVFRSALILALPLSVGSCALVLPQTEALRTQWPRDLAQHLELDSAPFFPQKDYQCGPASLATVMAYSGISVTPDDLVSKVYLPNRGGSLQVEMLAAPRSYGLVVGLRASMAPSASRTSTMQRATCKQRSRYCVTP